MLRLSRTLALLLLAFALWGVLAGPAAAEEKRKAKLVWGETPGAVKYEIEISASPELEPLIHQSRVDGKSLSIPLSPGSYFFHVRGIDPNGLAGPWSDVQGFTIHGRPPKPELPAANAELAEPAENAGIEFGWSTDGVADEGEILFELQDEQGTVVSRKVKGEKFRWAATAPGHYSWRVGYEKMTGAEWSKFRKFSLKPGAWRAASRQTASVAAETSATATEVVPDRWTFSVILRGAQAVVISKVTDFDRGTQSAVTSLSSFVTTEVRWRAPGLYRGSWELSGSANFELLRQEVEGKLYALPRVFTRVFAVRPAGEKWRVGPFLHLGAGSSLVYRFSSTTAADSASVSRTGAGLGFVGILKGGQDSYFSGIFLLRSDSGGASAILPGPLKQSFGYELGFGGTYSLTQRMLLEGRMRMIQESLPWTPGAGGGDSSRLENRFIFFDLGVGYRF